MDDSNGCQETEETDGHLSIRPIANRVDSVGIVGVRNLWLPQMHADLATFIRYIFRENDSPTSPSSPTSPVPFNNPASPVLRGSLLAGVGALVFPGDEIVVGLAEPEAVGPPVDIS